MVKAQPKSFKTQHLTRGNTITLKHDKHKIPPQDCYHVLLAIYPSMTWRKAPQTDSYHPCAVLFAHRVEQPLWSSPCLFLTCVVPAAWIRKEHIKLGASHKQAFPLSTIDGKVSCVCYIRFAFALKHVACTYTNKKIVQELPCVLPRRFVHWKDREMV